MMMMIIIIIIIIVNDYEYYVDAYHYYNIIFISIITNYYNRTALHWAASKGYPDILKLLFGGLGTDKRRKKYSNCPDYITGWTPLHCAALSGNLKCIEILLDMGGDIKRENLMGEIPGNCIAPTSLKGPEGREIARILGVKVKKIIKEEETKDEILAEEKYDHQQQDESKC